MRFSIVVPTYNREHCMARIFRSLESQSFEQWECLLVDDGSSDQTLELAKDQSQKDSRFRALARPGDRAKGANSCRNIGMEEARGEYICFLDSDDEWLPERLLHLDQLLHTTNMKGVYSGAIIENNQKQRTFSSRAINNSESPFDFLLASDTIAQTSSYAVRNEGEGNIKFDETLQRHQDYDYFIRFQNGPGWTFQPRNDVIIHWDGNRKKNWDFDSMIKVYELYRDTLEDKTQELDYLWNCWVEAHLQGSTSKRYYAERMSQLRSYADWKQKMRMVSPAVYHQVWTLLRKLRS